MKPDELKRLVEAATKGEWILVQSEVRRLNSRLTLLEAVASAARNLDMNSESGCCTEFCDTMRRIRGCRCGGEKLRDVLKALDATKESP